MRTFILILAIFALARPSPLRLIKAPVPDCEADIEADFILLRNAILKKSWSEIPQLIQNITKTVADCKNASTDIQACIADGKLVAANVTDIITAVKAKDLNPLDYINLVKSLLTNVKKFAADCSPLKPIELAQGFLPDDAKICVADLKAGFEEILQAFKDFDMSKIKEFVAGFGKTLGDCKSVFGDLPSCVEPVKGALNEIGNLMKYAARLDTNGDDYGTAIRSFAGFYERAAHECFDYNGPQTSG
jgi:hypothetical protein